MMSFERFVHFNALNLRYTGKIYGSYAFKYLDERSKSSGYTTRFYILKYLNLDEFLNREYLKL